LWYSSIPPAKFAYSGPGGLWHEEMEDLIEWVSHYRDGSREERTLARHQPWLTLRSRAPVLRLDGATIFLSSDLSSRSSRQQARRAENGHASSRPNLIGCEAVALIRAKLGPGQAPAF
jgi:hypothetical protein